MQLTAVILPKTISMKAAVIYKAGDIPRCGEVPDPVPQGHQQIIHVKAASIKNLDKMRAKGNHYDRHTVFPAVVGVDGVGVLADGTRVYAGSPGGMMAEKAVVATQRAVPLPDGIDDITAAALPNPGLSAWLSLDVKGGLKKGDTVFILGATGVTGRLAIQIAKLLGAGKIIAAGRNKTLLDTLPSLGADVVVSLSQPEEELRKELLQLKKESHFDVVIDYLWGGAAELLLDVLTGHDLHAAAKRTRYVQVGEMAGASVRLKGATLRSSWIELCGQGGGGLPEDIMKKISTEYLPKLFAMAAEGQLKIETEAVPLSRVEEAWQRTDSGRRMVVVI